MAETLTAEQRIARLRDTGRWPPTTREIIAAIRAAEQAARRAALEALRTAEKGLQEAHEALHRDDVQSLALDPLYSARVVAGLQAVRAVLEQKEDGRGE